MPEGMAKTITQTADGFYKRLCFLIGYFMGFKKELVKSFAHEIVDCSYYFKG
jgi:hypothetical protein